MHNCFSIFSSLLATNELHVFLLRLWIMITLEVERCINLKFLAKLKKKRPNLHVNKWCRMHMCWNSTKDFVKADSSVNFAGKIWTWKKCGPKFYHNFWLFKRKNTSTFLEKFGKKLNETKLFEYVTFNRIIIWSVSWSKLANL